MEGTLKPIQWAGTPSMSSGCCKPCPAWPGTVPGLGQFRPHPNVPQPLHAGSVPLCHTASPVLNTWLYLLRGAGLCSAIDGRVCWGHMGTQAQPRVCQPHKQWCVKIQITENLSSIVKVLWSFFQLHNRVHNLL